VFEGGYGGLPQSFEYQPPLLRLSDLTEVVTARRPQFSDILGCSLGKSPLYVQYGGWFIHFIIGGALKIWYLYAILTVVTWGLWGVFSKLASNYAKPRQALLFQTAGVLAFSVVVLVVEKFKIEWNLPGFSWAALGGFFVFIGFLTFFAALEKGNTSTVVMLSALYPMVTIMISIAFLHERLTTRQGVGIGLRAYCQRSSCVLG
jgi:transporter family protein